jgi:DHA2 family multidrug resistance protein
MSSQAIAIIITAAIASLLEILDSSIVNVAIPTMMGNIGATLDEISWVTTGYMIANSIVLPIAAWLGTRLGRRNYFTTAILLFTIASFACGIAPNLTCLIVFRIFQGLAGGALLPTSQTLIQEQFPREKAGMAMAIFGMSVMVGPALGPTLGGYLTDNFGWRSIFNVNIPLGLFAAVMSWLNVYDMKGSEGAAEQARKNGDSFSCAWEWAASNIS